MRGGPSEERIGKIVDDVGQIHPVEQVEDLTSELDGGPFFDEPWDAPGLHDVEVHVSETRPVEGVPAQIALLARRRDWKGGGWEQPCDEIAP